MTGEHISPERRRILDLQNQAVHILGDPKLEAQSAHEIVRARRELRSTSDTGAPASVLYGACQLVQKIIPFI